MKKTVLVIDDETEFLLFVKDALELRGFEVETATNAVEAGLDISGKKIDLILMDIKMPGINGLQACEALKRNIETREIPIIIISALSDESDIKRAYKTGISDYLNKPVDIARLVTRIKQILDVK